MGTHIIPFKGKNYSGSVNQNLLWRDGNVYLMDNHRAALWCWQQEIDLYKTKHSVFHLDRHTDCLGANLDQHIRDMPDLRGLSITDYLNAEVQLGFGTTPLFRWDNYLSLHLSIFGDQVEILRSADHDDGDDPRHISTIRSQADEIPPNLLYWLKHNQSPWIVNIDLDYFFCLSPNLDDDGGEIWMPMFSEEFVESIFGEFKKGLDENLIGALTICLTPTDFTPGWEECLSLSRKIFQILEAQHPKL
jgi:hypothetical protein